MPQDLRRHVPFDGRAVRSCALQRRSRVLLWLGCAAALLLSNVVAAHELRPAILDIDSTEQGVELRFRVNLEALLAGIPPGHDDTDDAEQAPDYDRLRALEPAELQAAAQDFSPTLTRGIQLLDGERAVPLSLRSIDVPATGDLRVARDSFITMSAPSGTGPWSIGWDARFGELIVRAGAEDAPDAFSQYLLPGERSDDFGFGAQAASRSAATVFVDYVRIGFVHIIPRGLDHILFVIGLFLLSARLRPLVWQITAFTLAHSLTLGLAAAGWIALPASVVEPLIALSIVLIAVENVFVTRLSSRRLLLVFLFGLLHGLGFAGVLAEAAPIGGQGVSSFLLSLFSFNLGVEIGQLCVVLACLVLVGWYRNRNGYRRYIVVPGSLAIGAVGLFWFVQRIAG